MLGVMETEPVVGSSWPDSAVGAYYTVAVAVGELEVDIFKEGLAGKGYAYIGNG